MPGFNKFNAFAAAMPNGAVNLNSDTVNLMLTNTQPNGASQATYSDVSGIEIGAGNGYTTGGVALTKVSSGQTGGTYKYIATVGAPAWTAGPGAMNPFRYILAYDTVGAKQLIGWWDIGSTIALGAGGTIAISLDGTNGVFQVA